MKSKLESIINTAKKMAVGSAIILAPLNSHADKPYRLETENSSWATKKTGALYFQSTTGSQGRDLSKDSRNRFDTPVYFNGQTEDGKLIFSYITTDTNNPAKNPATVSFNSSYISLISDKDLKIEAIEKKILLDGRGNITLESTDKKENIDNFTTRIGQKVLDKTEDMDIIKDFGESTGLYKEGILDFVKDYQNKFNTAAKKRTSEISNGLNVYQIPLMSRTSKGLSITSKKEIGSVVTLNLYSKNRDSANVAIHYDLGLKRDIERESGRIGAYTDFLKITPHELLEKKLIEAHPLQGFWIGREGNRKITLYISPEGYILSGFCSRGGSIEEIPMLTKDNTIDLISIIDGEIKKYQELGKLRPSSENRIIFKSLIDDDKEELEDLELEKIINLEEIPVESYYREKIKDNMNLALKKKKYLENEINQSWKSSIEKRTAFREIIFENSSRRINRSFVSSLVEDCKLNKKNKELSRASNEFHEKYFIRRLSDRF